MTVKDNVFWTGAWKRKENSFMIARRLFVVLFLILVNDMLQECITKYQLGITNTRD